MAETWVTGSSDVTVCSPWGQNGKHSVNTDDTYKLERKDVKGTANDSWHRPMLKLDLTGFPGDSASVTSATFHSYVDALGYGGGSSDAVRCNQIDPQCGAVSPASTQAAEFDSAQCDWLEMSAAGGNNWNATGGDVLDDNGGGEPDYTFYITGPTVTGDWDTSDSNLASMVQRAIDSHGSILLLRLMWDDESPFPTDNQAIAFAPHSDATNYPTISITYRKRVTLGTIHGTGRRIIAG